MFINSKCSLQIIEDLCYLLNILGTMSDLKTKYKHYFFHCYFVFLHSHFFRVEQTCNESVNGHFWSNPCLNCFFKWTWFVKTDFWSVIDGSRVRFPVATALIFFFFPPFFSLFWLGSSSVPLEFLKLANVQPSIVGPLRILFDFLD